MAVLLAEPLARATGAPWLTPSIWNWTVPLAVEGETVTVKETDWLNLEGFSEEASAAELLALFTTWPPASVPVDVR